MIDDDYYNPDDQHPIPRLDVVDVNVVKKSGGSDLFIVIASPLKSDHRSLERLLRKIENYLIFINSDEFKKESGTATPENTNIIVKIHPDSSLLAFDLLKRSAAWVEDNNAALIIDTKLPSLN